MTNTHFSQKRTVFEEELGTKIKHQEHTFLRANKRIIVGNQQQVSLLIELWNLY